MIRDKKYSLGILLVILKAEDLYYYTIFGHITNIYWYIKQNNKKSFTIMSLYQKRISTNFYKFHSKNNHQAFKNLFQIFLIYEFPFRKTGE